MKILITPSFSSKRHTVAALGTVKKGLEQKLKLFPGHRSATELEEVTVMSTAHRIW
jgi:hypothetical protein